MDRFLILDNISDMINSARENQNDIIMVQEYGGIYFIEKVS